MDLQTEKPSILDLPKEEVMSLIMHFRSVRRAAASPKARAKKQTTKKVSKAVSSLSLEDLEALMKNLK